MTAKWNLPDTIPVSDHLLALYPENPVFAEILQRRGMVTREQALAFLYPQEYKPSDPFDFPGMQQAVQIVIQTIKQKKPIGICGDFDTDGLTATAILYEGLRHLSPNIHFQIPVRSRESHGISTETIRDFHQRGVRLLITCDTGVSEYDAVTFARQLGMDVIITDHHTLSENPVNANAVINPQLLPLDHPMHSLSGAGVAYKFLEAVYRLSSTDLNITQFLDLAAIGIIGDQVPLSGEARFLAQSGIEALGVTERPGLLEMLKRANVSLNQVNEKIISHVIAPRLNSLSRTNDASLVIEFLTTGDSIRAQDLVQLAEVANTQRKQITDTIFMSAQSMVEQDRSLLDKPLLILESDEWHYSLLGLVASQLSDFYTRPVVVISSFNETTSRGSARSIAGIDITAAIAESADMLDQYGGHALAAGFSVKKENLLNFKRALTTTISASIKASSVVDQIEIDAILPLWDVTKAGFNDILEHFRPFGTANPVIHFFSDSLQVVNDVNFGKQMQHRRLTVVTKRLTRHSVLWWNGGGHPIPPGHFDMVYQVSSKIDRQSDLQISLIAFRPNEVTLAHPRSRVSTIEVLDWRGKSDANQAVDLLSRQLNCVIFAEGIYQFHSEIPPKNRLEVTKCSDLVLLTCPASYDVLREVLEKTTPMRVYVVALDNEMETRTAIMQAVTASILSSFRDQHGRLNLLDLAVKTSQTERSISLAVDWLVSKTTLRYKLKKGPEIVLDKSGTRTGDESTGNEPIGGSTILEDLEKSLEETAAFKRYYGKVNIQDLFSNIEHENPGQ